MAHTNVSSCVLSIVASFSSGLDVFKQLRDKRRRSKRPKSSKTIDDEELRLAKSLRQGPEDIGREYQKSIQIAGDYFAIGDAIAQTSLAEVLLRLNTGLVSIITSFLDRDKRDVQLDYKALTTLSERSRIDTCRTLRHLLRRMTEWPCAPIADPRFGLESGDQSPAEGDIGEKKRKRKPGLKHSKIRGPTLARVFIKDSSRPSQIAMVKPGERRKKSTSSNVSSKTPSDVPSGASTPLPSPPPYEMTEKLTRPIAHRLHTSPEVPKPRHKQSAANVKAPPVPVKPEALRTTKSAPWLRTAKTEQYEPLPPMPATAPLPIIEPRRRKQLTPTYYSMASDSTKLGEIPLHKWAQPFDFDAMSSMNRDAERNGWPVIQLDDVGAGKKKRFGLFSLFRRKEAIT